MDIKKTPRALNLVLDDNILLIVNSTKFLGVYIDDKLKWNVHINYVSGRISRGLGMISRVRRLLSFETLKILYYSLLYPYLYYCCIVWGGASIASLKKLEVLQNRALRLIAHAPFRSSSSPIYKRLNVLRLTDIRTPNSYIHVQN